MLDFHFQMVSSNCNPTVISGWNRCWINVKKKIKDEHKPKLGFGGCFCAKSRGLKFTIFTFTSRMTWMKVSALTRHCGRWPSANPRSRPHLEFEGPACAGEPGIQRSCCRLFPSHEVHERRFQCQAVAAKARWLMKSTWLKSMISLNRDFFGGHPIDA